MALHDTLRRGGRAARVHVADRVAILDVALRLARIVADLERRLEDLERVRHHGAEHRLDQPDLRLAVVDDVADLVRAPEEVDRDRDGADLRAGEIRLDELRAVAGDEQDRIAALHAAVEQRVREPVRQRVQVVVGEPPVAVDDRFGVALAPGRAREDVADVDALDEIPLECRAIDAHQYDFGSPSDCCAT
jgi:hypothetical protein